VTRVKVTSDVAEYPKRRGAASPHFALKLIQAVHLAYHAKGLRVHERSINSRLSTLAIIIQNKHRHVLMSLSNAYRTHQFDQRRKKKKKKRVSDRANTMNSLNQNAPNREKVLCFIMRPFVVRSDAWPKAQQTASSEAIS